MSAHPIRHDVAAQRFELHADGAVCVLDYERAGPALLRFTHTVTPPALRGRGLAGELVEAALAWAQSQGCRVEPVCSYVDAFIAKRPQWQALLS